MKTAAILRLAVIGMALAVIAGCAASRIGTDSTPDATASPTDPVATRAPFPSSSPVRLDSGGDAPDGVAADEWSAILEALDSRLGSLDASSVTLVSVEEVTWNDGSLGCPEPGGVYTQALVDGLRVVVEHDGEEYDYRIPNGGHPQLCESQLPRGG